MFIENNQTFGKPITIAAAAEEAQRHAAEQEKDRSQQLPTEKKFGLKQLGMPEDWLDDKLSAQSIIPNLNFEGREKKLFEEITRIEVFQPIRTIVEVIDIKRGKEQGNEGKGITLVFTGGGASPAIGQNIKVVAEIERELLKINDENANNGKPKVQIDRIIILPNITGAPRESVDENGELRDLSPDGTLYYSGQIAAQALKQLGLTGRVVTMGFSAGSTQTIETQALVQQSNDPTIKSLDLILLDAAGTTESALVKAAWNFGPGSIINAYKKNRRIFGPIESMKKAAHEASVSWVTPEGKSLRYMLRDIFSPKSAVKETADYYGIKKPGKPGIILDTGVKPSALAAEKYITGKILNIEMTGAGVVGNPADAMIKENHFPQAKKRTAVSVFGATHGSVMDDAQGNRPVTAYEMTTIDQTGKQKKQSGRFGSGEQRMNRIEGKGDYSPIARLVAQWLFDEEKE